MKSIYLDYNATAPLRPSAHQAMVEAMAAIGNASSVHRYGREVRQLIEGARSDIANIIDADPKDIIFSSGATESHSHVIKGFDGPVIVSAVEHASVMAARPDAHICTVDENGVVDLSHLEELLHDCEDHALVSVMMANNETGVMQPIEDVVSLAKKYKAVTHCDAVQALGKMDLSYRNLGIDFLTLSAHKIGGPQGVGALIANPKIALKPLIEGGGQERSNRAGTENLIGIVGFAAALREAMGHEFHNIEKWRDRIESEITQFCPETVIFGGDVKRLPHVTNLSMPGVKSETQVMNFDLAGIAVSAGAACSSGKVQASHVLEAMGVDLVHREASLRVSMGWQTNIEDVDAFIDHWKRIYQRCGSKPANDNIKQGVHSVTN